MAAKKSEELTFDQMRLWATTIEEGMLDIWRKAGRTCILMASLPDGRCTISAYETGAEALADKKKADIRLGEGHSIIRPMKVESDELASLLGVSDPISDAMNLIVPVLQAKHAALTEEAERISKGGAVSPIPPTLFHAVRKLGENLSLSITLQTPMPSYMQEIAWGVSDTNVMCLLAGTALLLLPKGHQLRTGTPPLVVVVHNAVRGVQLWTKDSLDALRIQPFEFPSPLSAKAGK